MGGEGHLWGWGNRNKKKLMKGRLKERKKEKMRRGGEEERGREGRGEGGRGGEREGGEGRGREGRGEEGETNHIISYSLSWYSLRLACMLRLSNFSPD